MQVLPTSLARHGVLAASECQSRLRLSDEQTQVERLQALPQMPRLRCLGRRAHSGRHAQGTSAQHPAPGLSSALIPGHQGCPRCTLAPWGPAQRAFPSPCRQGVSTPPWAGGGAQGALHSSAGAPSGWWAPTTHVPTRARSEARATAALTPSLHLSMEKVTGFPPARGSPASETATLPDPVRMLQKMGLPPVVRAGPRLRRPGAVSTITREGEALGSRTPTSGAVSRGWLCCCLCVLSSRQVRAGNQGHTARVGCPGGCPPHRGWVK